MERCTDLHCEQCEILFGPARDAGERCSQEPGRHSVCEGVAIGKCMYEYKCTRCTKRFTSRRECIPESENMHCLHCKKDAKPCANRGRVENSCPNTADKIGGLCRSCKGKRNPCRNFETCGGRVGVQNKLCKKCKPDIGRMSGGRATSAAVSSLPAAAKFTPCGTKGCNGKATMCMFCIHCQFAPRSRHPCRNSETCGGRVRLEGSECTECLLGRMSGGCARSAAPAPPPLPPLVAPAGFVALPGGGSERIGGVIDEDEVVGQPMFINDDARDDQIDGGSVENSVYIAEPRKNNKRKCDQDDGVCFERKHRLGRADVREVLDANFKDESLEGVLWEMQKEDKDCKSFRVGELCMWAADAMKVLKEFEMLDPNGQNQDKTFRNKEVHRKVRCLAIDPQNLPRGFGMPSPEFNEEQFLSTVVELDSA